MAVMRWAYYPWQRAPNKGDLRMDGDQLRKTLLNPLGNQGGIQ